jgi:hypothetical protein
MAADKHKGVQYNIRLDADLLKKLQKTAKQNHVSATAEIAGRLGKSFAEEEMWGPARHAIFAMAATFASVGQQEARRRNIKINLWTTHTDIVVQAGVDAVRAFLTAVALQPEDRLRLIEQVRYLEDPRLIRAEWVPMPDIADPEK